MAQMPPSRIDCDIDFDRPGRQLSCLRVIHSDNRHAFGAIPVPIACLAGGPGKTLLLTAGTHGDEYEGQVVLQHLIRALDPASLAGRLIVMPALNLPAVMAAARCSPLDDGNMNRAFPGDPDGGPTAQIAYFVETRILPLCDGAADLHSGGKASQYLPSAYLRKAGDAAFMARKLAAAKAFGAPNTVVVGVTSDPRSLSAACDRHGVIMVATELAGGGTVTPTAVEIGRFGVMSLMRHFGLLPLDGELAPPTRFLGPRDRRSAPMAPADGIFEPKAALGEHVAAHQLAGVIHPVAEIERPSIEVRFPQAGIVYSRRVPALVAHGDYLFNVGTELAEAEIIGGSP